MSTTPDFKDTRRERWRKMLIAKQAALSTPNTANNPSMTDTLRTLKLKLLRALNGG